MGSHLAKSVLWEHSVDSLPQDYRRVSLKLVFRSALLETAWVPVANKGSHVSSVEDNSIRNHLSTHVGIAARNGQVSGAAEVL